MRMPPDANELRNHFAFEVHYLVHSAIRFRSAEGKDRVAFQDSALLHARNVLEFTGPKRGQGWWIADLGGTVPPNGSTYQAWKRLINSKVTHLGDGRLNRPPWPVAEDAERCVAMSRYFLNRVVNASQSATDQRMKTALRIATLGLEYLDNPAPARLEALAALVG
jgi:hypothetical protein